VVPQIFTFYTMADRDKDMQANLESDTPGDHDGFVYLKGLRFYGTTAS
jgi:hypothetical protein